VGGAIGVVVIETVGEAVGEAVGDAVLGLRQQPFLLCQSWQDSASRNQGSHSGAPVDRPNWSKSFEVPPGEKGTGSGPSFPIMPPANASMLVLEVIPLDGTNADADAAKAV
jgi:hypothetical protein